MKYEDLLEFLGVHMSAEEMSTLLDTSASNVSNKVRTGAPAMKGKDLFVARGDHPAPPNASTRYIYWLEKRDSDLIPDAAPKKKKEKEISSSAREFNVYVAKHGSMKHVGFAENGDLNRLLIESFRETGSFEFVVVNSDNEIEIKKVSITVE